MMKKRHGIANQHTLASQPRSIPGGTKRSNQELSRRMNMESFETYRSYLFAIAYRMLGSAMDAEDMVQETYLRYQGTPPETITSHKAFLTTIISRLCMDQLHLARRKREQYLGPWLPEPISTAEANALAKVEERVGSSPRHFSRNGYLLPCIVYTNWHCLCMKGTQHPGEGDALS